MVTALIILSISQIATFGAIWWLHRELKRKTFLYWEQEGKEKVLRNSKGDEITRL